MKERNWTNLVTSLRHRQCVLVLGPEVPAKLASTAGSSPAARDLSYSEELTRQLASEFEGDDRRVMGSTLAAVAQLYEDAFGPNTMRSAAAQFYISEAYDPSDVHRSLASLPFKLILTTCHDALLKRALEESGKRPVAFRYHLRGDKRDNPGFTHSETRDEPVIYHLFGVADEPLSLVLSENDVLDFLIAIVSEQPPLPDALTRLLKQKYHSFLFVGFGIKELHLRILLKVLIRALELYRTGSTVATESLRSLSEGDREETILFYQRGARVEVEDAEIRHFLVELTRRLEAAGGVVTQAPPPGPRPRVFISYAREDGDLADRVCHLLETSNFEPWLDKESLEVGDLWDQRIQDQLKDTDYVLVLYTPALSRKTDSYVNKEIALARDRALAVRGNFLIPLRTDELAPEDRIDELSKYQEMTLRLKCFDEDMAKVLSTMRRDYQRRNR
jgi:TIR domain-containing protein/SIR2-like protein